ncbi:MAG: hypothetical protein HWE20_09805 [Gammaproteobacteria bacterium]|nr:hypothetical protein [Gammaproteobacteria bacterium]
MIESSTTAALWWMLVASGIYHGVNPAMGWPLSVSAALMERRFTALLSALGALALGHFLAMAMILLPFSMLRWLFTWHREVQVFAAILLIALGSFYLIFYRRHPRFLARIPPGKLTLWSFLVALAHGAGLMLVPIYLGICQTPVPDAGHQAATELMTGSLSIAVLVAVLHTLAMMVSGGVIAALVYRYVGLKFLQQSWFNLDLVWAASLVLAGVLTLVFAH